MGFFSNVFGTNKNGPFEMYHDNGQLEKKATFKDGEFDGPFEMYHENGQLEQKATFKDGEFDGPFEMYDENGQMVN
jgi:antitoxin component YwqK of YwqJK toxin-antitoxin module